MTSPTSTNRSLSRGGFTLIELSIVVFILLALTAVSVPTFLRSYNESLVDATARSFITTCQYARVQAVIAQQPAVLHVDLDRQMFWVTQTLPAEPGVDAERVLKVIEMSPRVLLVSAEREEFARQRGKVDVIFYPNGTCDAVTVVFRGNEKRNALGVSVDPVTTRATSFPMSL